MCQANVFVRSMCMSIFWLPAPMVAVWRVSGMWGSVVCGVDVDGMWRVLVCGDKCYVGEVAWEVNGILGDITDVSGM